MVSAPHNFERRRSVRRDMLDLPSVRDGATVFRFLLGRVTSKTTFMFGSFQEFQAECTHHGDVLLLNSLDGPGPSKQCSCAEKTVGWMRHAQQLWPAAAYYGKTEGERSCGTFAQICNQPLRSTRPRRAFTDDAYVQLRSLELELRRMHAEARSHVLYGSINLCSMPSAPKATIGYRGAWLGRIENLRTAEDARRVIQQKMRRLGAGSGAPFPFATGDLQVMDRRLAHALFRQCSYLSAFVQAGRRANRRSGCRVNGTDYVSSWATLTCDCAFGLLLSECSKELRIQPTIAHMTETKSHNYATNAGSTSATAPSRLSIVVHALKFQDTWRSGPERTRGGEWNHTHATARYHHLRGEDDPGFPPMLWRFAPAALPNETAMEPIDGHRQEWYYDACHPRRSALKRRIEQLAAAAANAHRCSREWCASFPVADATSIGVVGSSDTQADAFLGGRVGHWTGHGCHPARGYAYPRWPQAQLTNADAPLGSREYRLAAYSQAHRNVAFDWDEVAGV